MRALRDLLRGIRRHPLKLVSHVFVAFSVMWTITEALSYFVPGIMIKGSVALGALIFISIVYGLKKVWKPSKIAIDVAHTNTCIVVLFGDLFQRDGIRAIAVNDFFDSELGKPVSENSLHGIFLNRCFGGYPEPFDKQIHSNLKEIVPSETVERDEGKTKRYPIGTTALLTAERDRYIAVALTQTDISTSKVSRRCYYDVDRASRALAACAYRVRGHAPQRSSDWQRPLRSRSADKGSPQPDHFVCHH